MKTIQATGAQNNLVELVSESLMATLIIGLSITATLVAVMMVIAA